MYVARRVAGCRSRYPLAGGEPACQPLPERLNLQQLGCDHHRDEPLEALPSWCGNSLREPDRMESRSPSECDRRQAGYTGEKVPRGQTEAPSRG